MFLKFLRGIVSKEEDRLLRPLRTGRWALLSVDAVNDLFAAAAFSSPATKSQTRSDLLTAGNVRVMRSLGGLGESCTGTASSSCSRMAGEWGNRELMWPSAPMPKRCRSKPKGAKSFSSGS